VAGELVRAQIITRKAADLARDHVVNTIYLVNTNFFQDITDSTNWNNLATDLRNVFAQHRQHVPSGYGVETKLYAMEDPTSPGNPRPVRGQAGWLAYGQSGGEAGPRDVALCLSFRGERNIARQRGRIYIGPWTKQIMDERPPLGASAGLKLIAEGIGNVGGGNIDWVVRSGFPLPAGTNHAIKQAWIDNEWDTMRSRGLRATSRDTQAMDE
jgi:hypothetical protein